MKVKHLIKLLEECDPNSDVRAVKENCYFEANEWVIGIEENHKGDSGYEFEGEVRLITNE